MVIFMFMRRMLTERVVAKVKMVVSSDIPVVEAGASTSFERFSQSRSFDVL